MTKRQAEPADLYGVPLDEFTTERDRLARGLRDEGRREEAERVSRMRKPTTDAWALNQVARSRPELVQRLTEAHRSLREAGDVEAMRRASESRQRLVDEIVDAAGSALERAGHSSARPVADRIARTLLAAGDPGTEQLVAAGTLQRPVEISDQWPATFLPRRAEEPEDSGRSGELERLEATARESAARAGELQQVARRARDALTEARREAEAADRAAREAESAARDAERELRAARRRSPRGS